MDNFNAVQKALEEINYSFIDVADDGDDVGYDYGHPFRLEIENGEWQHGMEIASKVLVLEGSIHLQLYDNDDCRDYYEEVPRTIELYPNGLAIERKMLFDNKCCWVNYRVLSRNSLIALLDKEVNSFLSARDLEMRKCVDKMNMLCACRLPHSISDTLDALKDNAWRG